MRKKLMKLCLLVALAGTIFTAEQEAVYGAKDSDYKKIVVADVSGNLNVREKASTDSRVVGRMKKGAAGTILKKGKEWTKIKSGEITGYVSNEYVITGAEAQKFAKANIKKKDVTVTTDVLNVRAKNSTTSKVLGKLKKGEKYPVESGTMKWIRIKYKGKNGYLSREYIDLSYHFEEATPLEVEEPEISGSDKNQDVVGNQEPTPPEVIQPEKPIPPVVTQPEKPVPPVVMPPEEEPDRPDDVEVPTEQAPSEIDTTQIRREIVEYALQYVGYPYVYGGTSLTNGADCSGFVQSVLAKFGIKINRVSADQALNGREVAIEDLQPGDLVFYMRKGGTRISHVAMYIGNDQVVHALNESRGICVTNMYYNTPYTARNMID